MAPNVAQTITASYTNQFSSADIAMGQIVLNAVGRTAAPSAALSRQGGESPIYRPPCARKR